MTKSKSLKLGLAETWQKRDSAQQESFLANLGNILFDYGLRMSGQSNPQIETIEKISQSLKKDWENSDKKFSSILVESLKTLRSSHADIWMNNTDALRNPKLDTITKLAERNQSIKTESSLNKLYPHAKELILLKHWFGLSFKEIDMVLEEQSGRTEKLYQQAVQHLGKNLKQSDNSLLKLLIDLPLYEKPIYTRNETQDISMIMDDYSKQQKKKKHRYIQASTFFFILLFFVLYMVFIRGS